MSGSLESLAAEAQRASPRGPVRGRIATSFLSPLSALVLLAGTAGCVGDIRASNDFLAFGEINASVEADGGSPEYEPLASFFYSHQGDRFRAIAEYVYAPLEKELERLQLGVRVGDSTVWVGRFHSPVGYVNSVLHHGSYLETSITRSRIWAYEDEGGVIPMHVSGMLFEGERQIEKGRLQYQVGVGAGTVLTPAGLEPVDLLRPSFVGSSAAMAKVSYFWDDLGESVLGGYVGHFRMQVEGTGEKATQRLAGVFINRAGQRWAVRADAVAVDVAQAGASSRFANAHLQVERNFGERTVGYVRGEATAFTGSNAYLARFPGFVRREVMVGMRYDFSKMACGKLQVSRSQTIEGKSDNFVHAQLCFMFSP